MSLTGVAQPATPELNLESCLDNRASLPTIPIDAAAASLAAHEQALALLHADYERALAAEISTAPPRTQATRAYDAWAEGRRQRLQLLQDLWLARAREARPLRAGEVEVLTWHGQRVRSDGGPLLSGRQVCSFAGRYRGRGLRIRVEAQRVYRRSFMESADIGYTRPPDPAGTWTTQVRRKAVVALWSERFALTRKENCQ